MKPLDDVLAWCSGHIPHVTSRSHLFLYRLTGKRFGSRLPGARPANREQSRYCTSPTGATM